MIHELNTAEGCRRYSLDVRKEIGAEEAWANALGEADWMAEAMMIELEEASHDPKEHSVVDEAEGLL